MTGICKECSGELLLDRQRSERYCSDCYVVEEKQRLSMNEGDSVGYHSMNKDVLEYDHSNNAHSPRSTTFYADDAPPSKRRQFERLWRYNDGSDSHGSNYPTNPNKIDHNKRDRVMEAEALCSSVDMSRSNIDLVRLKIASMDTRPVNYLGGLRVAISAVIFSVNQEAGKQAIELVSVNGRYTDKEALEAAVEKLCL